jgi:hypothetical protein
VSIRLMATKQSLTVHSRGGGGVGLQHSLRISQTSVSQSQHAAFPIY